MTRVRASLMKDHLAFAQAHPAAERLLDSFGPELITEIEQASRIAWIPGQVNIDFSLAVDRALGRRYGQGFYYGAFAEAYKGPLLGGFVRAALRLSGTDPGGMLKLLKRGTELVFQGFGDIELGARRGVAAFRSELARQRHRAQRSHHVRPRRTGSRTPQRALSSQLW